MFFFDEKDHLLSHERMDSVSVIKNPSFDQQEIRSRECSVSRKKRFWEKEGI